MIFVSESNLDVSVVEEFIKKEPKYIELKIINIFGEIINIKDNNNKGVKLNEMNSYLKNNCNYKILINWCIESQLLFHIITSIMNSILIQLSGRNFIKILHFIQLFIYNLIKKCKNSRKNFIDLYPWQYRHLVYLLHFKTVYNNFKFDVEESDFDGISNKKIIKIIQDELNSNPEAIITLLSHHSSWNVT